MVQSRTSYGSGFSASLQVTTSGGIGLVTTRIRMILDTSDKRTDLAVLRAALSNRDSLYTLAGP
jgi:hypothetical protein